MRMLIYNVTILYWRCFIVADRDNSCSRCRRQKIKCTGKYPCEACSRRKIPCQFDDYDQKVLVNKG